MFLADLNMLENEIGQGLKGTNRKNLLIRVANNWYKHADINLSTFTELLNEINNRYGDNDG